MISLTSFMLLNNPESKDARLNADINCEGNEPLLPLTSTGDFLGFYTTIALSPNPFPIEVVSFPAFSSGTTTIQGPWSPTISFTQTNVLLPTNTSTYNPVLKELVCLVSSEQQLLEYEDIVMSIPPSPLNVFPTTATAPVYFLGNYYAIEIENNGYADMPLFEADIVNFDYQTATFSSVMHLQNMPLLYTTFTHESMSSATNITDELYFLSGSSLVIVTDLSVFTPAYCWIDLDPNRTFTNYFYFYGVEYKSPGVLMAIRETFANGNRTATDLVQINFNSTACTVSSITVIYDMMNNFQPSPDAWVVNSEFYSTAYDTCRQLYYLSTLFDHNSKSRLVEIDVQNPAHVEQILPQYLFGIEWKQNPCPCEVAFDFASDTCQNVQFFSQSTGSNLTYSWNFDDGPSGVNNTSSLPNPNHQFTTCGNYNVCLTISGSMCNGTICHIVQLTDIIPPVAKCKSGVVLALDANCMASTTAAAIDDGSYDECSLQSLGISQGMFNACGNYPVTLIATDWCGNTSTCNTIVQVVDNIPPVITCPPDVYLTTTSSNCTMVVNGLQWLTLTDNCGIPTVTYQIAGATTFSGNGNASGQIFNPGISTVTYTATDNCGNTSACSFKVELICSCICPNNIVLNSGFNNGAVAGDLNLAGRSDHWQNGPLGTANLIVGDFCCEASSIELGTDESLFQQGLTFIAGHQYAISFCGRFQPYYSSNTIRFGFTATNSPVSAGFNPVNCTNCETMGNSGPITSTAWSNYTLPIWTPTQNWNSVVIRAFNTSFSIGRIDNICIREISLYMCCEDEDAFIENADNAINTYVDQENWEGVVEIGNLWNATLLNMSTGEMVM